MTRQLKILVAADGQGVCESLAGAVTRLGHQVVAVCSADQLLEVAQAGDPALIVADAGTTGDVIEAVALVNRCRPTPVILLAAQLTPDLLQRVAAADHIMVYLIKPVEATEVEAAITVALARFERFRQVRQEADELKQMLEDRKLIERAKGSVMKRLGVGEDEAFRRLRRAASAASSKVVEVARAVL